MSKEKDEVVTAVRALLDGLEADWAARLQEAGTKPESTDYLVIEAIGIGRTQIVVAVRQFLDDLQAIHCTILKPAALSVPNTRPKRPRWMGMSGKAPYYRTCEKTEAAPTKRRPHHW